MRMPLVSTVRCLIAVIAYSLASAAHFPPRSISTFPYGSMRGRAFVAPPRRHRDLDLVDLGFVADVGRAREARIRNSHTIEAKLFTPALLQLGEALHHARGIERARLDVHRLIDMEEVGRGRAERGPQRAEPAERDDDALTAQLARVNARVHGAGASGGEHNAAARAL